MLAGTDSTRKITHLLCRLYPCQNVRQPVVKLHLKCQFLWGHDWVAK